MSDKSDYNKPRTKLHQLLPEPYQSDVNTSLFENHFNRFLTKTETEKVAGYVGKGNPAALISRQIREPDVHRQAFQLQPMLYNKIGSIEHMTSWKDIQNELSRLGVDLERMPEWLQTQVFNWVPHIDIDKLIHYRDYFWEDESNPTSQPQYLTIRSRCETVTAQADFHQSLVDQYTAEFTLIDIASVDEVVPSFSILEINSSSNYIRISGDATSELNNMDFVRITATNFNNGQYQIISAPSYDSINDWTTLNVVVSSLVADEMSIGTLIAQRFDKLIIQGEYNRLFEPGFVFFFKNSTNTQLDSSFLSVVKSDYQDSNDTTIIQIGVTFSSNQNQGILSLQEQLDIFLAEQQCQCTGSVGWDILHWDDNPNEPIWDGELTPLITSISETYNPNDPPNNGAGTDFQLWFDTSADQLYQYHSSIGWKLLYNNFQTILDATEGLALWDFTSNCGVQSKVSAADQWIEQNKWIHKSRVTNFSVAKQAQIPIIEFDWDLELNEWNYVNHVWKYRKEKFVSFETTTLKPSLIELISLNLWETGLSDQIILDERYGDLTDFFTPGTIFQTTSTTDLLEVTQSVYESDGANQPFRTKITITENIVSTGLVSGTLSSGTPSTTPLRPHKTSLGDPWKSYHDHWLYVETTLPVAINHQPENPLIAPLDGATVINDTNYDYVLTPYAQIYTVTSVGLVDTFLFDTSNPIDSTRPLHRRALVNQDDIRVYINDVRTFGTYIEISSSAIPYVDPITGVSHDIFYVEGIQFLPGFEPTQLDIIQIEVGEASIKDIGLGAVPVRTIEDNTIFENIVSGGPETKSLIQHRRSEQVKSKINQYPLFDMYNSDGSTAYLASEMFGFLTSSSAPVNGHVGLRLVVDTTGTDYSFQQTLCNPDTSALYVYRDYSNTPAQYWVNLKTETVKFWTGLTWTEKTQQGLRYQEATVSSLEPSSPFEGQIWLDTNNQILKLYSSGSFDEINSSLVNYIEYDITLQSIWKKGLNDEKYISQKVDWKNRSLTEYNNLKDVFVEQQTEEIIAADSSITQLQAEQQAEQQWFDQQTNHLSPTGEWMGDWEIPDPLYFNNQHENRKIITSSEVLSHFNSIINAQPDLPAFNGPDSARFHLIRTEDVNYGLGGTIHEYNNTFDTFLSIIYNNNVTPLTLFEFAHDQYESLINGIKESIRKNSAELLTDTSSSSLVTFSQNLSDVLIDGVEQNDDLMKTYGDSTTYDEVQNLGIRNWIATLPYLMLVHRHLPELVVDEELQLNQVIHHDGHRKNYFYEPAIVDSIYRLVSNTPDPRSSLPSGQNGFGIISNNLPPDNIVDFKNQVGESLLGRPGIFWYTIIGNQRTMYRLSVADVGVTEPSVTLPDGSLWVDMNSGSEVLRQKNGVNWDVVSGLTVGDGNLHNGTDVTTASVSAWKKFNINTVLSEVILEIENKLYQNAPNVKALKYNFSQLTQTAQNQSLYQQLLKDTFLNYVRQREIIAPFSNIEYDQADPFTWNYKRSTPGVGYLINTADEINNQFYIDGNVASMFIAGTTFFIKNSTVNDGTWTVAPGGATDVGSQTIIPVNETVTDSFLGIIYQGTLPSAENTGGESGGDWKDLYNKLYGTPYPHLEPWKLQGYQDKPSWWDTQYSYDGTGPVTRLWNYIDGTNAASIINSQSEADYDGVGSNGTFVGGDGAGGTAYAPGDTIILDNGATVQVNTIDANGDILTFTVTSSGNLILINTSLTQTQTSGSGTGFVLTPSSNNIVVAAESGMWKNIKDGIVPNGQLLPDGTISTGSAGETTTYNYFSVNISNIVITDNNGVSNYSPDQVLPPYFDHVAAGQPLISDNRSIFQDFVTEIVSPGADYSFGDAGPIEFEWRISSQFLYDQLTIAFKMFPVDFINSSFGFEYDIVNSLQIDKRTGQPPSHTRTLFHGDIQDKELIQFNGLNQWYVNYNRYQGFDLSLSDFRNMWTSWTAPMTYQFYSFVDTSSLQVGHRTVPISNFDYNISAKRSPGAQDFWIDAFNVKVLYTPPNLLRYDNQSQWQLEIDTNSPLNRNVRYYDVHRYQFSVDPSTDICTLYSYAIDSVDIFNNTFTVKGNHTQVFSLGRSFEVSNSTGNDGTFECLGSVYDNTTDKTIIDIDGDLTNSIVDGTIIADYRSLPWQTGDSIWFSSEQILPAPLQGDQQGIGPIRYFIIKISDNQFKVANTKQNALNNLHIDITSSGHGNLFVGQLVSSFFALDGLKTNTLWKHYAVDKSNTLSFTPPYDIKGMQTFINIIDGYAQLIEDTGFKVNDNKSFTDPDTGRFVDWQLEIERFIDFAYGIKTQRNKNFFNRYEATIDIGTDVWTWTDEIPNFITGSAINVLSSNSVFPTPIVQSLRYYIIRDNATQFRLATSKTNAEQGIPINITSDSGVDQLYIAAASDLRKAFPSQEVNPFRNALFFNPQSGIVSNLLYGPSEDIRNTQLLFDQYGRPLNRKQLRIYRQDKQTHIQVIDNIDNDVELTSIFQNPYNYIHLGGAHLFVDVYEHVLIFNNNTTEGSLLYDPFLGLNVTKFELIFHKHQQFNGRPNIGGSYLTTYFNQGAQFLDNFETGVENIRYLYDSHRAIESKQTVQQARKSLGYEGTKEYLDNLNLNQKSQFLFWRGLIQNKGSLQSVKAFVNSRRFIDARVDEFWAYKIAEFGSVKDKEYPEMYLTSTDARTNDLQIEFVQPDMAPVDDGFIAVDLSDQDRWYNQPDQLALLRNNGLAMYLDLSVVDKQTLTISSLFIFHNFNSDNEVLTLKTSTYQTVDQTTIVAPTNQVSVTPYLIGTNQLQVFKNGTLMALGTDYTELNNTTLQFTQTLQTDDIVEVVHLSASLLQGTHYQRINSKVIEILDSNFIGDELTIWGQRTNTSAQNPAKIIDKESKTVVTPVQFWDPARGLHHQTPISIVNIKTDQDPAIYSNTQQTDQDPEPSATHSYKLFNTPWNDKEVGTVWLDTTKLDYIPYYDELAITSIEEQLKVWGQLADWGQLKLYEWVESDVPPQEYNELAMVEEGNRDIPEHVRKAGRVNQVLFENVKDVVNQIPDLWVVAKDKYQEFNVTDSSVSFVSSGVYDFTLVDYFGVATLQTLKHYIDLNGTVNIYINGVLTIQDYNLLGSAIVQVSGLKQADTVRFIQSVPSDPTIDDINYKQDYQYSQKITYDELGLESVLYYFWVEDKGTRNQTQTLSPKDAQQQLIDISAPYITAHKVVESQTIPSSSQQDLTRQWIHNINQKDLAKFAELGNRQIVSLGVTVKDQDVSNVTISVNGTQLTQITEFTLSADGRNLEIDPSITLNIGDVLHVEYIITIPMELYQLPDRQVQITVRGLRGIITDQQRYTLRFTRDFTLRDVLSKVDSSLDLKQHHEEWRLFRKDQITLVPQILWNKVIEALVGYTLNNSAIRVPSLDRELYDQTHGTDTRFGLESGQAFTDGQISLQTVLADLQNPNNSFSVVDINSFFATHSFDTPENIIDAMNTIYNSFAVEDVNRIFFEVLHDAFSVKKEYPGIFKTSMIAIHGIRPFQQNGLFDD